MVQTYDPEDVKVIVDGNIITGFADGTFVTAEKDNENFTTHVGAKGGVTRTVNKDPLGSITLNLSQTSPSLKLLNQLAKSKDLFPAEVIDRGTNKFNAGGNEAWIEKPGSFERGNDVTEPEWVIKVADYDQETV